MARPRKNVILFLVEGPSDLAAFERPLQAYVQSIGEQFEAVVLAAEHDVTSDNRNNPDNILEQINKHYFRPYFSANEFYYPKDILEVVQLCDTDGVFVPPEYCKEYDLLHNVLEGFVYDPPYTYGETAEQVIDRNERKAANLRFLKDQPTIKVVSKTKPYSLCFCSLNLEHCLHGSSELNISGRKKIALGEQFADKYEDPDVFRRWLNESEQTIKGVSLAESWSFIEQGLNSTGRYTNINIYLEDLRSRLH